MRSAAAFTVLVAAGFSVPVVLGSPNLEIVNDKVTLNAQASCGAPGAVGGGLARSPAQPGPVDAAVPGRLIVRFRSEAASSIAAAMRDADGCPATGIADLDVASHALSVRAIAAPFHPAIPSALGDTRIVTYAADIDPHEAAALLARSSGVEWAEPDLLRRLDLVPNDAHYPVLQWQLFTIEASRAWDFSTGVPGVTIAVIDTGLEHSHPDLAANVWTNAEEATGVPGADDDLNGYVDDVVGWDFVSVPESAVYLGEDPAPPDGDPADFYGHGTWVAGVAAAVANNVKTGPNIVGACWSCRVMGLRAAYKNAVGNGVVQTSAAAEALVYAADNGARIVNMSYGGPSASILEEEAIRYARARGLVLVASAGNIDCPPIGSEPGDAPSFPASYPGVISVAATDSSDEKACFSKYGASVDLSAPGDDIFTTSMGGLYATVGGTSFSAPLVAGVAGLLVSEKPARSADAVEDLLKAGAVSIDALNPAYAGLLGAGRLNAWRSIAGDRLGVTNFAGDPPAPQEALAITALSVDPNAAWLSFPAAMPAGVAPGATVYFDPAVDESLAECGLNTATVTILSDDPSHPATPVEARLRVDCDLDKDGYDCAERGGIDCDDGDPSISPGAIEICNGAQVCAGSGGGDEDCDGAVDEGCSCVGKPNVPVVTSAAAQPDRSIRIEWRDLADNEDGFRIHRRRAGGSWVKVGSAGVDALAFTDTTARPGRRYQYSVRAWNRRGASPRALSPQVTVPKAP